MEAQGDESPQKSPFVTEQTSPRTLASRNRGFGRKAAILVLCAGLLAPPPGSAVEVFVAPDGDDADPGSRQQPFASLERARDAVRASAASGPGGAGATVWIRGRPLLQERRVPARPGGFRQRGSPGCVQGLQWRDPPLHRRGRHRRGLLHPDRGGLTVVWHRLDAAARGNLVECDLPALGITAFGDLTSAHYQPIHSELSFDGEILPLGRWPNEDFALIYRALSETTFVYDHHRPDRWTEATAPWVNGYWRYLWANKYLPVTAIDTAANVFTITDRPGYPIATGRFWYGLNLLEEIDRPGEWYLERDPEAPGGTFGRLYLWPPEELDAAEIMLSLHGGDGAALVRLDSVGHVRFEGLTFELTRGDGIVIEGSRDVVIDRCVLRNIGGQGIATGGCARVGVLDSELYGIGSEAVRLSGGDRPP